MTYVLFILFLLPDPSSDWGWRIEEQQQVSGLTREQCEAQRVRWSARENVETVCVRSAR